MFPTTHSTNYATYEFAIVDLDNHCIKINIGDTNMLKNMLGLYD